MGSWMLRAKINGKLTVVFYRLLGCHRHRI
jgi:hypothetical protein